MPNSKDPAMDIPTYQLQRVKVQAALLQAKQAHTLVNNFLQRASYKKLLTEIEKNVQDIKALLDSPKASTLLDFHTSMSLAKFT